MKQKIAKRVISILIVLSTIFFCVLAMVSVRELRENAYRLERRYQFSDFLAAYEEGRYYEMYRYALHNEVRNGVIYEDTSQMEAFGRYFNALMMYRSEESEAEKEKYYQIKEAEKEKISWSFLKETIEMLEKES